MAAGIYKKGQGYWTRVMSAIGLGLLAALGAVWLWEVLRTIRLGEFEPVYTQGLGVIVLLSIFAALGYWLIGVRPRVVDFMIATEGEMKKVNWSTKREVIGSTWIVICLVILMGLVLLIADIVFQELFRAIRVLEF